MPILSSPLANMLPLPDNITEWQSKGEWKNSNPPSRDFMPNVLPVATLLIHRGLGLTYTGYVP